MLSHRKFELSASLKTQFETSARSRTAIPGFVPDERMRDISALRLGSTSANRALADGRGMASAGHTGRSSVALKRILDASSDSLSERWRNRFTDLRDLVGQSAEQFIGLWKALQEESFIH